jgi:hypothetical protein
MTSQVRDEMHYEGDLWAVWGINGESFFAPAEFGLDVDGEQFFSTACWRGYYGTYGIHEGFLQLLNLEVNLDEKTAPALNGRLPTKNPRYDCICGDVAYLDVGLSIPFSGGLLLCRQWITQQPSSIGPELAWRFEQIRELIFDSGGLVQSYNHSEAVARIREEVKANNVEITAPTSRDRESEAYAQYKSEIHDRYRSIEAKINACFEFDY